MYVILYVIILDKDKFKHQGEKKGFVSYFQSNPLCANFAYVFLNNYSIDFDQASVKSRSVYLV